MVAIYDNRSDVDSAGWFNGARGFDALLSTAAECQAICEGVSGCRFFSFEVQQQGQPEARCYLKAAYADPSCTYSAPLPRGRPPALLCLCA